MHGTQSALAKTLSAFTSICRTLNMLAGPLFYIFHEPMWDANCACRTYSILHDPLFCMSSTSLHNALQDTNCTCRNSTSLQMLLWEANCACRIATSLHELLWDANFGFRTTTNLHEFYQDTNCASRLLPAIMSHCGTLTARPEPVREFAARQLHSAEFLQAFTSPCGRTSTKPYVH